MQALGQGVTVAGGHLPLCSWRTSRFFQAVVAGGSWGYIAIPVIERRPYTAIIGVGSLMTLGFGDINLGVFLLQLGSATWRTFVHDILR
jgi:hypothetical protein